MRRGGRRPVPDLRRRIGTAACLVAASGGMLGGSACGRVGEPDRPVALRWRQVELPAGAGRILLGDLLGCAGRWYALGGRQATDGATQPAAWSSVDGLNWTEVPVRPVSPYGAEAVFRSAACSAGGGLAAVAAVAGGVHANPRTGTWHLTPGGALVEVSATFELYGGNRAVSVVRVGGTTSGGGFVIAGDRVDANGLAGAAVWTSPDGVTFSLVDDDPALMSTPDAQTSAAAAVGVAGGWLLAGSVQRHGAPAAARDPLAWWSPDGARWQREELPAVAAEDEAASRVVAWSGGVLAVGVRGTGFGAWLREPAPPAGPTGPGWRAGGRFGRFAGAELPAVTGLAVAGTSVYAAVCDGSGYALWVSPDGGGWRRVGVPATLAAGAQRRLIVAGDGGHLLLGMDDGATTRLWLADIR